ncbi:hypothetical protein AB0395_46125 [Streptosporangium sp. NPDC051023]|uniref:hypothetical protein n=1 Tax=Streptosporangium sp. NPDC051023 TaxID=3155410 RepID=UPI00344DEE18
MSMMVVACAMTMAITAALAQARKMDWDNCPNGYLCRFSSSRKNTRSRFARDGWPANRQYAAASLSVKNSTGMPAK